MNAMMNASSVDEPSPAVFAEAGAWLARLHGPNRSQQVEQGFRRWLAESPQHAAAFEAMNGAWDVSGRLSKGPFPRLSRWQRAGYREGFIRSAVAVAAVVTLAIGALFYLYSSGMTTGIGEQRNATLQDGTRVFLNTDSKIVVDYDKNIRQVRLVSGEALFEVAKETARPFVVLAGDRRIRALGTAFVVRRDARYLAVTLVEGKVNVAFAGSIDDAADSSEVRTRTLMPGQRLTFAARSPVRLDQPEIKRVTAWRRGLMDFEDTPLAEAIDEMNRYSATKLIIEDAAAKLIPISGMFRVGDNSSFAAAVARAYGLQVRDESERIVLSGVPASDVPQGVRLGVSEGV